MSTAVAMRTAVVARNPSDVFVDQLCRARDRVLLLDYDGTIAPFSAQRNRAFPYPTVPELLDCIMSTCHTRVLLISGRSAREIPPLLGLNPHPEIWGSYGIERLLTNGRYFVDHVSDDAQFALAEADACLQKEGLAQLVEVKPGAIAVHWRGLNPPQMELAKTVAYRVLSPLALRAHLLLAEFDGGVELREPMRSKADVVRLVLSEHSPDVPVAYLGDDTTDEDAFRVLNGRGLTVLVRSTYRFTAAQTWIRPPEELVQFLTDWVRACGGEL
jgi:trehalose 6-phosphate phosphatase